MIHLGDHDPSGIDMTRDNNDRLATFAEAYGLIEVRRIALNMDQVEEYNPPANPTKMSDSRSSDYVDKFGSECWELDALQPAFIEEIIQTEIRSLIDQDLWDSIDEGEEEARKTLRDLGDNWEAIKEDIQSGRYV